MSDAPKPAPIVYLVEDEKIITQTLALILKTSGFQPIAFTKPLEALRTAEAVTPSLLISDVMMPEMNGIELGIRMRAISPGCKVLLFSGQPAADDLLIEAQERGHDFHIL